MLQYEQNVTNGGVGRECGEGGGLRIWHAQKALVGGGGKQNNCMASIIYR